MGGDRRAASGRLLPADSGWIGRGGRNMRIRKAARIRQRWWCGSRAPSHWISSNRFPLVIERLNAHYGWACIGRVVIRQGPVTRPPERVVAPTPVDPRIGPSRSRRSLLRSRTRPSRRRWPVSGEAVLGRDQTAGRSMPAPRPTGRLHPPHESVSNHPLAQGDQFLPQASRV